MERIGRRIEPIEVEIKRGIVYLFTNKGIIKAKPSKDSKKIINKLFQW